DNDRVTSPFGPARVRRRLLAGAIVANLIVGAAVVVAQREPAPMAVQAGGAGVAGPSAEPNFEVPETTTATAETPPTTTSGPPGTAPTPPPASAPSTTVATATPRRPIPTTKPTTAVTTRVTAPPAS